MKKDLEDIRNGSSDVRAFRHIDGHINSVEDYSKHPEGCTCGHCGKDHDHKTMGHVPKHTHGDACGCGHDHGHTHDEHEHGDDCCCGNDHKHEDEEHAHAHAHASVQVHSTAHRSQLSPTNASEPVIDLMRSGNPPWASRGIIDRRKARAMGPAPHFSLHFPRRCSRATEGI